MSIVCPTCPLDFHHFPGVISVPLSPLHKGTIVSAPSPSLFEVLHVTCLCVVLGTHQRRSLTFFCLCPGIRSRSHPLQNSGIVTDKRGKEALTKSSLLDLLLRPSKDGKQFHHYLHYYLCDSVIKGLKEILSYISRRLRKLPMQSKRAS